MSNKVEQREKILVSGDSMSPLYSNGDILWMDSSAYENNNPEIGDIIVCNHPYVKDMLLVKKVSNINEDGRLFILGLNSSESTDSRSFGTIAMDAVLGKIIGKVEDSDIASERGAE